jgi:hypothetical protein
LRAPAARLVPDDLRAGPRDVEPFVFPEERPLARPVFWPVVRPVVVPPTDPVRRPVEPRRCEDFEPRAELALERRAAVRGVVDRRPYSP